MYLVPYCRFLISGFLRLASAAGRVGFVNWGRMTGSGRIEQRESGGPPQGRRPVRPLARKRKASYSPISSTGLSLKEEQYHVAQ